jgi:sterol desaturase/sphingolipid hydroxylase (fatty acid hydroxylase superfamily)
MILGILGHIFCYDVWFYISHIILHNPTIYGSIHKIHHSRPYQQIRFQDTHTAHWIENVVQPIGILIPYTITGAFSAQNIIVAFAVISARGLARHDDRCSWLIGNHHLLHHKYTNYNFGEYWIDVLCGTRFPQDDEYIHGMIYT